MTVKAPAIDGGIVVGAVIPGRMFAESQADVSIRWAHEGLHQLVQTAQPLRRTALC